MPNNDPLLNRIGEGIFKRSDRTHLTKNHKLFVVDILKNLKASISKCKILRYWISNFIPNKGKTWVRY